MLHNSTKSKSQSQRYSHSVPSVSSQSASLSLFLFIAISISISIATIPITGSTLRSIRIIRGAKIGSTLINTALSKASPLPLPLPLPLSFSPSPSSLSSALRGRIRSGSSSVASFAHRVHAKAGAKARPRAEPSRYIPTPQSFRHLCSYGAVSTSFELSLFRRKGRSRLVNTTATPAQTQNQNQNSSATMSNKDKDDTTDGTPKPKAAAADVTSPTAPKTKTSELAIDLSKLVFGSDDVLFGCIERNQKTAPLGPTFGTLLDAGTGSHSLRWIASLMVGQTNRDVEHYTAVTADDNMRRNVLEEARSLGIDGDGDIIIGNWKTKPSGDSTRGGERKGEGEGEEEGELCHGEKYDTILADYLVGAIDGFSPYYQDQIFPRLVKHLKEGGRMYVVGLNPIPDKVKGDGDLFCRVTKLRDACILLASHRSYREYPPDWIKRHMKSAGLNVIDTSIFPIMYTHNTIVRQLNVARSKLPLFASKDLAKAMGRQIDQLEEESLAVTKKASNGKIQLGFDYVITGEMPIGDSGTHPKSGGDD